MTATLTGRKILIITTNFGTETDEIQRPLAELKEAGAEVVVAAAESGPVKTLKLDREPGPEVPSDILLEDADAHEYDALVIPGGTLNADTLRAEESAQELVKAFAADGKPVAAICHGPWLLIDSDLVDDRDMTSVPTISNDLLNAGATWTDQEVVVDTGGGFPLITSRNPDDLDAFNGAIIKALTA
ncbi:type 1 glutamine amidotransferase [Brachybacterium muris]|uniref:type 1 glutamine amidotransferase domain-containing protein n=1 Tax=Brachybacterium muris TaxID=219301 RepID=UPI00223AD9F8|nr:type 1 glutamine amidotransferase domain-containing protein [Brachybacterium muris]MCT1654750.1 type 1 glutamine amidotransferase [Brachybacterium muris]MCT1998159.1 type 1 glutamine amidotransferase [Brachybacterium muris]MCT2176387.1 type 1 glutamine amidotransferase [Brachybacterium muris]MCT2260112.1 type 1 glutamine amidotransferase [Brachybacterium muris]